MRNFDAVRDNGAGEWSAESDGEEKKMRWMVD